MTDKPQPQPQQPDESDIPEREKGILRRAGEVLMRANSNAPAIRSMIERDRRWGWMREANEMIHMLILYIESPHIPADLKEKATQNLAKLAEVIIRKNEELIEDIESRGKEEPEE